MYLPSFQAISRDLAASDAPQVQWTLAVFFGGLGLGQAFYGPISDRYGRMGPLCFGPRFSSRRQRPALARSIEGLVAWRFVQSIGGCAGIVIARRVVRDVRRAGGGPRLLSPHAGDGARAHPGALAGGQILVLFGWRAIFWTLGAFGLAA
jgi:DHA1 family bicyclomycin/chloramphenicol resistance-like MFS transporter